MANIKIELRSTDPFFKTEAVSLYDRDQGWAVSKPTHR
jgi:hypothetical protein